MAHLYEAHICWTSLRGRYIVSLDRWIFWKGFFRGIPEESEVTDECGNIAGRAVKLMVGCETNLTF